MWWFVGALVALWGSVWLWDMSLLALWPGEQFRWWQPFTYWMLHGTALHLIANLSVFVYLYGDLKKVYGWRVWHLLYISCLLSGLVHLAVLKEPVIGMSGGVFAMLIVYGLTFWYHKFVRISLWKWVKVFVVLQTIVTMIWPEQLIHFVGMCVGMMWMYVYGRR